MYSQIVTYNTHIYIVVITCSVHARPHTLTNVHTYSYILHHLYTYHSNAHLKETTF